MMKNAESSLRSCLKTCGRRGRKLKKTVGCARTKVKKARAEASTAQWFADKLSSTNIKCSKMQPKDFPDASAHVEGSGGVNTIWLDPHGAGGDRSLDLIHETFHIDPPGLSDIDISPYVHENCKIRQRGFSVPLVESPC